MFYKKISQLVSLVSISALALSLSGVSASAQNVNATLNLTGGALTIDTTGASCTLTATVSNSNQTVNCTVGGINVTDARGTGAGWSSTYTVRNFYSGDNAIPLCPTVACTTQNLIVTMAPFVTNSGDSYGVTDTTVAQTPTGLSGMSATGVNSPAFSLLAFNNASQTYGKANITNAGTGYSAAPTVVFTGGGCTQNPVATATVSGGSLTGISFSTVGLGCTSAPAISFTGGGSNGAATPINGAGEGSYTKSSATNGFALTIPARSRAGTYTSIMTISAS
jgi:hypothetical protein